MGSGGQAALSTGCLCTSSLPQLDFQFRKQGTDTGGAPEPSRPCHSSTAGAENSLDTDICHRWVLPTRLSCLLP